MTSEDELKHLYLLVAAGSLVYRTRETHLRQVMPSPMRCALYMLAAFALRRKVSRRLLRKGPSSVCTPSPVRSGNFLQELSIVHERLELFSRRALKIRRGSLSISYQ